MICSSVTKFKDSENLLEHYLQTLCLIIWMTIQTNGGLLASPWSIILLIGHLPMVFAAPNHNPYSDITFQAFSQFVEQNFSSKVSLATVLVVLFTITSNPDLLNLHARLQNPVQEERGQTISGWIKALARALEEKLGDNVDRLFKQSEHKEKMQSNQINGGISIKLDILSKVLKFHPYDTNGKRQKALKSVSEKDIEPAYVICPTSMECQTISCNGQYFLLDTRDRDVPRVTLIKGAKIYDGVHVLTGKCTQCDTRYYADHESSKDPGVVGERKRFYLNSAKYLKVGQSLWVDRTFSGAVINATYSFHASSAAFAEFWNDSFRTIQETSLESFLDGKSGMHLYKNIYAGLHNHLGIHWNLKTVFQLMM
jgi:CxC5 like cysteine cluster associated with KDZ transposases